MSTLIINVPKLPKEQKEMYYKVFAKFLTPIGRNRIPSLSHIANYGELVVLLEIGDL